MGRLKDLLFVEKNPKPAQVPQAPTPPVPYLQASPSYWFETNIRNFIALPPLHILKNIEKAKKEFTEFRVVTVTVAKSKILDPLIIAYKKDSDIKYLIDYWDKDIDPTELVK